MLTVGDNDEGGLGREVIGKEMRGTEVPAYWSDEVHFNKEHTTTTLYLYSTPVWPSPYIWA